MGDDKEEEEMELEIDGDNLVIGDVVLNGDLDKIEVDGKDISRHDETYVTEYGFKKTNPDDSTDENRFKIVIPEQQLLRT